MYELLPKHIESDILGEGPVPGKLFLHKGAEHYTFGFYKRVEPESEWVHWLKQSVRMSERYFLLWQGYHVFGYTTKTQDDNVYLVQISVSLPDLLRHAERELVASLLTTDTSLIPTCDRQDVLDLLPAELVECCNFL